jgi:hypothetical protein
MTTMMLGNTPQELFRLFSKIKNEHEISVLQKGTVLDDTLEDVQAFITSRAMQMQLVM